METKRKLEPGTSEETSAGNGVKRHKKKNFPDAEPDSSPTSPSSSNTAKQRTKTQSRLQKLQKLTRKLLNHPEQIPEAPINGSAPGPDLLQSLTALNNSLSLSLSLSLSSSSPQTHNPQDPPSYYSQSPLDRLYTPSLHLHAQNILPPLPPVPDKSLQTAIFTHEGVNDPTNTTTTTASTEKNYERLELLGDAYIEIFATRLVWDTFPRLRAGRLSQIREMLVKNETLAEYATRYGLDRRLQVAAEIRRQAKTWTKVRGDLFEAYVAAVILSHPKRGVEMVEEWLTQLWIPRLEGVERERPVLRYKEELAKMVMDKGVRVRYVDEREGVQRKGGLQTFFVGVYLDGWGFRDVCLGTGTGMSKVIAGNEAARKALENPVAREAAERKRAFHAGDRKGSGEEGGRGNSIPPPHHHHHHPPPKPRQRDKPTYHTTMGLRMPIPCGVSLRRTIPYRYRPFSSSPTPSSKPELAYQIWPSLDNSTAIDEDRNPIVFMHGLFGSKQNNRSISKALAAKLRRRIWVVDLRNHGDSPHLSPHDYMSMSDDVEAFIQRFKLHKPALIGHSMGAKTAMTLSLRSPQLISSLISVDNAPVSAKLSSQFVNYVKAMQEIERAGVTKQSEADKILERYEESLPIRQFLLTNLIRNPTSHILKFRLPLSTLASSLDELASFPYNPATAPADLKFEGPALFIRGTRSGYVKDSMLPAIDRFFPRYQIVDVEAGHWVISENGVGFKDAVTEFLKDN
ncbi:hypothetical protein GX48_04267 [Paracoccidioides brasiliensis]|nr:hypothetical protein GX48_04267 [Paracoccidioides brasiliensis]